MALFREALAAMSDAAKDLSGSTSRAAAGYVVLANGGRRRYLTCSHYRFEAATMSSKTTNPDEFLTRGALAAQTACNIETIRYYEQIGILPAPPRSQGGHRLYGQALVRRLHFVLRSRDLGFALEEIRELLRMVDGDNYTCGQVEALALEHVQAIRRKMADLKKLKVVLETMASQCGGGKIPKCPIIDALFDARAPIRSAR